VKKRYLQQALTAAFFIYCKGIFLSEVRQKKQNEIHFLLIPDYF